MTKKQQRIKWIDLGKCLAIMAVAFDHAYVRYFDNQVIWHLSFFSVSLFILLAGYSEYISYQRHKTFHARHYCKRIILMFLQYSLAILFTMFLNHKPFSIAEIIKNIFGFSLVGAYYYFAFFFQLVIIAPVLERLCFKLNGILHQTLSCFGILLASIFLSQMKIFDIYGGGGYILGGTYLFLYYLGMLMAKVNLPRQLKRANLLQRLILLLVTVGWGYAFAIDILPFDSWAAKVLGPGLNPPSINISIYACLVMGTVMLFGQRVDQHPRFDKVVSFLLWVGQNTLPIFLYHSVILWAGGSLINYISNHTLLCVINWFAALIIPALCNTVFKKCLGSLEHFAIH